MYSPGTTSSTAANAVKGLIKSPRPEIEAGFHGAGLFNRFKTMRLKLIALFAIVAMGAVSVSQLEAKEKESVSGNSHPDCTAGRGWGYCEPHQMLHINPKGPQ